MKVAKPDQFTLSGWPAVGSFLMIVLAKALTALVVSYPLVWLANYEFAAGGTIRAIFGTNQVSYWRCVGLFAIWQAAWIRIKFSKPGMIEIQGKL